MQNAKHSFQAFRISTDNIIAFRKKLIIILEKIYIYIYIYIYICLKYVCNLCVLQM